MLGGPIMALVLHETMEGLHICVTSELGSVWYNVFDRC